MGWESQGTGLSVASWQTIQRRRLVVGRAAMIPVESGVLDVRSRSP